MDQSTATAILALAGAYFVIVIAYLIVWVIANWRIFTKAGEAGWKSIIPFYNMYTLYKFSWKAMMFWVIVVLAIISAVCNVVLGNSSTGTYVADILLVISGVINIIQTHKLSKCFGHGIGFTLGLIFLNPIFMLILAFGSSRYQGAQN